MTSAPSVPGGLPAQRPYRTWPQVTRRWIVLAVLLVLFGRSHPSAEAIALTSVGSIAWAHWSLFNPKTHPSTMVAAAIFGFVGAVLAGSQDSAANGGIAFACAASLFLASMLDYALSLLLAMSIVATICVASLAAGHGWFQVGPSSIVAIGWAVGNGRRAWTLRAEAAEALLAETIRANAGQAEAGALAERARIAREIHDVLAHSLSALTLQLEAVDALLTDGRDPVRAHEMVVRARRTARDGLEESRRAVSALRDDVKPLDEMLASLVDGYRVDTGAGASLSVEGDPAMVPVEVAQGVQRVVREALTNVRKHARGASVTVRLGVDSDGAVRVSVENSAGQDGAATGLPTEGGYGLVGVRERVELLGGTVSAGTREDGTGWVVSATVPSTHV